jgi:ribosomal protein S18 acetylase RimI-like enzyme
MITVEPAAREDIVRLVELEAGLFREDAGRHDPFADTTWPDREGRQDFERLLANPHAVVLVARDGVTVVGHLVGYLSGSSPTRQPVTYGVLRSLYVDAEHRNSNVGAQLTDAFVAWAIANGCAEAHVESYAANEAAQRFYERLGFQPRSVSLAMRLEPRFRSVTRP